MIKIYHVIFKKFNYYCLFSPLLLRPVTKKIVFFFLYMYGTGDWNKGIFNF